MSTKSFPRATNEVAPTSGKFPVVIPHMPSVALKLKVAQSWQPPDKSMYKISDMTHFGPTGSCGCLIIVIINLKSEEKIEFLVTTETKLSIHDK